MCQKLGFTALCSVINAKIFHLNIWQKVYTYLEWRWLETRVHICNSPLTMQYRRTNQLHVLSKAEELF
jgi:hypothetical protein